MALTGLCAVSNFICVFISLALHPQLRSSGGSRLPWLPCPVLSCLALQAGPGSPALLAAVLGLALGMGKKKEERGMFGNNDAVGPLLPSAGSYNFQNTDPSWM